MVCLHTSYSISCRYNYHTRVSVHLRYSLHNTRHPITDHQPTCHNGVHLLITTVVNGVLVQYCVITLGGKLVRVSRARRSFVYGVLHGLWFDVRLHGVLDSAMGTRSRIYDSADTPLYLRFASDNPQVIIAFYPHAIISFIHFLLDSHTAIFIDQLR